MKRILKLIVWVMLLGLPVVMTSCDLGFFDNPVSPDLKVLKPSITVQVGKSYRCNVHASTKAKLTFTSADPSIATVDSYGVVTGVKTGKTTIAVKTSGVDDFYNSIFYVETATIDVEVIKLDVPVKSVKLDKTTLTATLGDDPVKLVATVNPDNADFKTVEWTTSDETVVEVEDGVVTFVGAGTATITATATNGTEETGDDKTATCEVTVYNLVNLAAQTANYTAQEYDILTGTLGANVKISIAAGATVTLKDANINGVDDSNYLWAGITCVGDATIILSGTNTVKGFQQHYPGITVAVDKTLTIKGDGKLTASCNGGWGAGIGAGRYTWYSCGNIEIQGGDITATGGPYGAGIGASEEGTCGNITISGGKITATGGTYGAGIGGGNQSYCGDITITDGVTQVTATRGANGQHSIGKGKTDNANYGTVTIGGVVGYISALTYTYPAP